jgi:bifunctional UDP-N-acetylglucosamine pyrophosphorylase/glucosamine-1-phosphate N-acetyltransferase
MNIVILAAGQGKRMYSALPKVLHRLAGKPLLAHVIDTATSLGPERVCIVYGHGGETVRQAFSDANVEWALQEPQLGTGHAVQQALPHMALDDVTLILYGDVPLVTADTMRALLAIAKEGSLALLTVELDDPTGYGRIVRDANGLVRAIVEHKDASAEQHAIEEVNTGIMALPTQLLARWLADLSNDNAQQEYYLTDIVAMAVAQSVPVHAHELANRWESLGVNSKIQLAELERILQGNIARKLLTQGVTLADPGRIDVRGELSCGRDVSIDVNCVFEGKVTLADEVIIGAHCVLRNATVEAGARIEPYSHIDDAIIGPASRIGPYARLRPGTVLGEDVHVGNFVEVKASTMGDGSKANHLSYVGDASVGRNVNIGAGTITCNYDGANKHRTVIEDDVHIGSDTQLVAPVTVGKGVTTGAGATVTKDVPPGALMYTKAETVIRADWQRPVKQAKKDRQGPF